VVRRDGPNADKAFELLRKTREKLDLDMKLYRNDTSMTQTANVLMDMIQQGEKTMSKIPIFDIPDTLLPTKKETNKTIKRKLNQQGIRDVPDFPIDEYNAHRPEEIQEWLDENDLESDAEKLSLAYQGSARRFIQRKKIVDALRELGKEQHGPTGFITNGSLEEREFYEAIFKHR